VKTTQPHTSFNRYQDPRKALNVSYETAVQDRAAALEGLEKVRRSRPLKPPGKR
jgi:hypothetical protein